jgi:hypothetical protein
MSERVNFGVRPGYKRWLGLSYCTDIGKLEEVAVIRVQDRKNNLKVTLVKIPPARVPG